MKQNNLDTLFNSLEGQFDIADPQVGHQQRFMAKLNQLQTPPQVEASKVRSIWRPLLGVAASLALLFALFVTTQRLDTARDLASVSPEMAATQKFFTSAIQTELAKLKVEEDPEFQELIVDALFQIEVLEQNYEQLKVDLNESGDDKLVIYAMIDNFQNRIDILQNVLQSIEELKQNEIYNENSSTL